MSRRTGIGYEALWTRGRVVKLRVGAKALKGFKERVRQITSRNGGRSLGQVAGELRSYLLGWKQ